MIVPKIWALNLHDAVASRAALRVLIWQWISKAIA